MRTKPPIRTLPLEIIDVPVPLDEPPLPRETVAQRGAGTADTTSAVATEPITEAAVDLGPNGPAVRELLVRAASLSKAERRRLGEVAEWRWWPLTLPVGGTSAGARATAILRARGGGRADAVRWIEARAAGTVGGPAESSRSLVVRATANAALALLARDLVDEDVFDALYGPWREVTHR